MLYGISVIYKAETRRSHDCKKLGKLMNNGVETMTHTHGSQCVLNDKYRRYVDCLIESSLRHFRLSDLSLVLLSRASAILTVEQSLSVRVEVKLGDHNVRRVDAERNGGT